MLKNSKHINYFILTFALVLFSLSTNAQEVRVIDNKGTIQTINNNSVKTSASQSTPADYITNIEPTYTPIENDTYIFTPVNSEKVYYVYDGATWNMMAPTKASRVFYPPSVSIPMPAAINGVDNVGMTYNLYSDYTSQFSLPASTSATSTGAPTAIPTYSANELYYYVTHFDTSIFANISIDAVGVMTYDVTTLPTDDNTIINVVFVVK